MTMWATFVLPSRKRFTFIFGPAMTLGTLYDAARIETGVKDTTTWALKYRGEILDRLDNRTLFIERIPLINMSDPIEILLGVEYIPGLGLIFCDSIGVLHVE